MPKIYYGCSDLEASWEEYFELCNAFELDLRAYDETPTLETLNGWRVESPRGFCYILHADPELTGELARPDAESTDFSESLASAWERTLDRADALASDAILVQTSERFTPGSANREQLEAFGEQFAAPADPVVLWEPSGLWTIEQTRETADDAGLVPVYDPFMADREDLDFPPGDVGFAITERAAKRRKFEVFDFERLLEWVSRHDRVFAMLRGRHQFSHAELMKTALERVRRTDESYAV
ncbi:MAG: DUF72 domain-containing protein [Bradymonadaceae bacterium]